MTAINPVGRPTKLTPDLIAKAQNYLNDYLDNGDIVPSVAGLAVYLDLAKKTIYNYKEQNAEFLHTLERIEAKQEQMLLSGGLSGQFNSAITKLMMANHGYSDKQNIDHVSSDKSMTPKGMGAFYDKTESEEADIES